MPTINDLRNRAALIGNATQVGENTASRVGTTFDLVADLLDGMGVGQGILSIDLAQLNTLNTPADQTDANPTIYNVTTLHNLSSTTIKVGTLLVFSDGGRSVVTQVLFSNYQVDGGGNISSPNASQITMYYRMYNIVQGTWSTWTLYAGGGGGGTIDPYPVSGSTNAVESNGVFERLEQVAPQVDIEDIDDIDDYTDMLAGVSPFYCVTKTSGANTFRVGTLMVLANHTHTALYQILATDFDLDANGDIDTSSSTNGGLKLIWRGKIFSGNVPTGWTLNQWSKWQHFTEPNNEDIDYDENGKLQFANKAYDASEFSGLGRCYLRKNIQTIGGVQKNVLVSSMFPEANTIYIIQYDYDLNGATINVPANCVLFFEGGSISNGEIHSDNVVISNSTKEKILTDVVFAGACVESPAMVSWFVSEYPTNTNDYSVDNTNEIRQALNCGKKRIVFPNDKYLHISSTIQIEGNITLDVEKSINDNQSAYRTEGYDVPCIFTKEVVTMLEYNFKSTTGVYQLYIGALNFANFYPFVDLSDKDTPVIKVTNTLGNLWGLYIYANIKVADRQISSLYTHSFTGLKIVADTNYITMCRIYGEINGVYRAVDLSLTNGAWFTDCKIYSDIKATFGGRFNAGGPVGIYGSSQAYAELLTTNSDYYFEGTSDVIIYGFVWDLGVAINGRKAAVNLLNDTNTTARPTRSETLALIDNKNKKQIHYNSFMYFPLLDVGENLLSCNNLLDFLLMPANYISLYLLYSPTYTLDGVDLFSNDGGSTFTLYNYHNLFNSRFPISSTSNATKSYTSAARAQFASASNHTLVFSVILKIPGYFERLRLFYKQLRASATGTLLIEELDNVNDRNVVSTIVSMDMGNWGFYHDLIGVSPYLNSLEDGGVFRITITGTYTSEAIPVLPTIFIPTLQCAVPKIANTTSRRPAFGFESSENYGFQFFDTSLNRPVYYHPTHKWLDGDGFTAAIKIGKYGERPTLQARDKGFLYYDTSLHRLIYWNGTEWCGFAEESVVAPYLTTIAKGTGTITLTIPSALGTTNLSYISYSIDGTNWVKTNNVDNTEIVITTPELSAGQKVYWKGIGSKMATSESVYSNFSSTTDFALEGDLLSLLYGDEFGGKSLLNRTYAFTKLFTGASVTDASRMMLNAPSLGTHAYSSMFKDCVKLVKAPNMSACTSFSGATYVYAYMFKGCTSLLAATELPATTLSTACYREMYAGCTALTTAQEILPATTLASYCYYSMFNGCSNLATAPVLPAVTLESNCYYTMFSNCSAMNYVKAMFTTTPSNSYTYNWLNNVAANGTFVKNSAAEWTLSGATGIPNGWTVETASE